MTCDEPGCTGVHDHNQPRETYCPRTQREKNERDQVYKTTAAYFVSEARRHTRRVSEGA